MKLISRFRVIATVSLCACLSLLVGSAAMGAEKEEAKKPAPAAAKPAAPKPAAPVSKVAKAPADAKSSPEASDAGTKGKDDDKEKKSGGADDEKKKEEAKPAKPTLHKVSTGEFELKVELDGILEAAQSTPIAITPEEWGDLTVIDVVSHGTMVKKGDILLRLDTEKLREEIANIKKGAPLAQLTLKMAHQELEALEKTTPRSLEAVRRSKMEAEQDFAYYEDVSKAMRERDTKENVKRLEQSLAYQQEELNQLEKMYNADDLTEETEEIILQRARNDVAYYEWMLEGTRVRAERTLGTSIPREHASQRRNVESQAITWRQAEQSLPDGLRKKRLEIQAQERAQEKSEKRLADLEKDLAGLTVKAPHDGIVYYGASKRGKWITAATVERKLVPGGKLMPREVILTLVKAAPLQIKVAVPENKLRHLKPGLNGFAWPAWNADAEFKTQLKSISFVPFADGTYDATFTVPKSGPNSPTLYPGMKAKVRLDLYEAADAITVPKKGVHKDASGHYVHLKDGKKRKVKVGKSNDAVYEILQGLKKGDEIKVP